MAIEDWLRNLTLAPKSKANIRGIMHLHVQVRRAMGIDRDGQKSYRPGAREGLYKAPHDTSRTDGIRVLLFASPTERAVPNDGHRRSSLGLRVSEIMALKWSDFDFTNLNLLVQRSIVHGRVGPVKTEYSHDVVPLDRELVFVLQEWRRQAPYQGPDDWLFGNPQTGRPYHQEEIQKTALRNAAIAAEIGPEIGWHTFRHTYRSWLDATGAPLKVQQ